MEHKIPIPWCIKIHECNEEQWIPNVGDWL